MSSTARWRPDGVQLYAAGDVTTYPGKLKLIATGFGEAATAVNQAVHWVYPEKKVAPGHKKLEHGGVRAARRLMEFDDYERAAARTINAGLTDDARLMDAAAGLAEEAGETLGLVRKHMYAGHPLDKDRLRIELGDVLWCLAITARSAGLTLEEVALGNVAKLERRYPQGFSTEASRARDPG